MTAHFAFPRPLGAMISRLPTMPPSFVFSHVLNLVLRDLINENDFQPLQGKVISIHVSDAGLRLYFTVQGKKFLPVRAVAEPDLAMSATAHDFYLLVTRKEDPDSLFFSRRLVVEGSTELGLVAKNTLDGIELPTFTPSMLAPNHVLSWVRTQFSRS